MEKIYGLIKDGGDGSAYLQWFRSKELVDFLLAEVDGYSLNEGAPAAELDLGEVDDEALKTIGIDIHWFTTIEEIKDEYDLE